MNLHQHLVQKKKTKRKYCSSYQGQKTSWHLLENRHIFGTSPLGTVPLINNEILDDGMAEGLLLVICMSLDELFMLLKQEIKKLQDLS